MTQTFLRLGDFKFITRQEFVTTDRGLGRSMVGG
jgi:hypothetical protein